MSRGSEQTFFQGLHRDVQQTHEKMLNIPNHQRSVNQNHKEISTHTYQNGQLLSKGEEIANVGKDVDKKKLLHC